MREATLPDALERWGDIAAELEGRQPAVFLDYDGTLTPIVERPDLATLGEDMRRTLRRLASACPTTIISGRSREDIEARVGIEEIHIAGVHGFDIAGAGGIRLEVEPGLKPLVAEAAAELRRRTADIPGVIVEDKGIAVAVHYRRAERRRVPEVERIVREVLARRPALRKGAGKKVFELRPATDWGKGRALLWLMEALGLDRRAVVPVYVGDDVTDEDAFRALAGRGIGILVAEGPRPTAARYSVRDVRAVRELLDRLAALASGPRP